LLAPQVQIPDDLAETVTVLEFALPSVEDIHAEVTRLLGSLNVRLSPADLDALVQSCQGLSMERIRRVLARGIAAHGTFRPDDIELVWRKSARPFAKPKFSTFIQPKNKFLKSGDWIISKTGYCGAATPFPKKRVSMAYPIPVDYCWWAFRALGNR
jgi:hypothetical protein